MGTVVGGWDWGKVWVTGSRHPLCRRGGKWVNLRHFVLVKTKGMWRIFFFLIIPTWTILSMPRARSSSASSLSSVRLKKVTSCSSRAFSSLRPSGVVGGHSISSSGHGTHCLLGAEKKQDGLWFWSRVEEWQLTVLCHAAGLTYLEILVSPQLLPCD